jgi:hypothetical protein
MTYAIIENGQIERELEGIPTAFKNVSGFDLLSDTERAAFGFHALITEDAPLAEWQKHGDVVVAVNSDGTATKSRAAIDMTEDEKALNLRTAKKDQISLLAGKYSTASQAPVQFTTAGGVEELFQADANSVANVQATLLGLSGVAKTPAGFYWVAANNTQVPFTYADVQGLAAAMLAQGWVAFQQLQARKAAVLAETTVAAVEAVTW